MNGSETFYGKIETKVDVLKLLELANQNKELFVKRRLHDNERRQIRSGSIFVYDEAVSGIKRWTDGMIWSPSRTVEDFLIYRELVCRTEYTEDEYPNKTILSVDSMKQNAVGSEIDMTAVMKNKLGGFYGKRSYSKENRAGRCYDMRLAGSAQGGDLYVEEDVFPGVFGVRSLLDLANVKQGEEDAGNEGGVLKGKMTKRYYFKPNGFIKKTISCLCDEKKVHIVCYYSSSDFCSLSGKIITVFNPRLARMLDAMVPSGEFYFKNEVRSQVRKKNKREKVFPGQSVFKVGVFKENEEENRNDGEKENRDAFLSEGDIFPMFFSGKARLKI
ncbi:MAG: Gti1/Pac2 family protein [Amphiamblys sp. WSBS2006]|nr:MAG: Gti1/Pac2 family protein [Amphiamblys sp. WSBS2006]